MGSLELVDLIDADGKPIEGLVPVRQATSADGAHERAVLLEAATFEPVDYVFFRRFKDAANGRLRSSQILAYVIDNSQSRWSEDDLAKWHREMWLHGASPLIYVAWPTRIDILSCARAPDFWHVSEQGARPSYTDAVRIDVPSAEGPVRSSSPRALVDAATIATALRRRLSAFRLAEGTFWDDPANQKLAKADAAAHPSLIQAIVEADDALKGGEYPVRRRLLVLTVLIKYLEDRGVFPQGLFGRFHAGARSFLDILRDGTADEVRRLLHYLERKFNGDVFSLGPDINELTSTELARFAKLVGARQLGGQQYFWELFSFENIPVEVISRLYQRFVTGHGAVYTPPLLATLLLDEVMPYDRIAGTETILDPACGSGVFLVGAFKRLVVSWRSRHAWRKPTVDDLKAILTHSIHGVELEPAAVDLTAFSLALAVCDALEPPIIWSTLKLDKLRGRNLREGDFFDRTAFGDGSGHVWPSTFDVVVGNPPFASGLTEPARAVDAARGDTSPGLPDRQAAYLFLEQGISLLTPGGSICLIQPHGLLYNSKPGDFRRYLMTLCRLRSILDFVSLRGLYEGADPKTFAWHAVKEAPTHAPITHITFRRTYAAAEQLAFEIDHYDWHLVPPSEAAENPFVWRVNLLGGGRLHELSSRFRKMTTLALFVENQGDAWDYGEGFIAGKTGARVPAPFLTGKPLLPTQAFGPNGIDRDKLRREKPVVKDVLFKSPYTEARYTPPLLLIKAHSSLPLELWNDGFIAYRDKVIGIHAPKSDAATLGFIFEAIQSHKALYQLCCALNGTQALTGKATVPLKQDIDLLPVPDDPAELDLVFWEDILKDDVLSYMTDYVRLGQGSNLLKRRATPASLHDYSEIFVRLLGSLYRGLGAADPVWLNGLIAQPFYFGARPDVSWLGADCENSLHKLIYDHSREALRAVRIVRYYEGNVILIVKPDRLRYWIRSTAIRDADDTLADLRRNGW